MITTIFLFPFIAPKIPVIDHYPDIMIFAGIYCLISIGLSILMGYAGQISLGHAAFYGIGAYISGILTTTYGLNPWLCMIVAAFVTAFVAFGVATPALKLKGHYLAMATLAFGSFMIFNII